MASLQDALFLKRMQRARAEQAVRIEPIPQPWWCEAGHGVTWQSPFIVPTDVENITVLYCKRHLDEMLPPA